MTMFRDELARCPICGNVLGFPGCVEDGYECPGCRSSFHVQMVDDFWRMSQKDRRHAHAMFIDVLIGNWESGYADAERMMDDVQ